jgi:hypothetical protein
MTDFLSILIPLAAVGVAIYFILRMRREGKPKKKKVDESTRRERAVWAWAKILDAKPGSVSSFGVSRVEMNLEVHLPGTSPYPAKVTWLVDKESLDYVEVGKEVPLRVDPEGPDHIYPNGSWAKQAE